MGIDRPIRIGTRGSALALIQARMVGDALAEAHGLGPEEAARLIDIVPISTTGDRMRDRALATIGGKGLFTKEIEQALLDHAVDLAVHSMKDMPVDQPPGLAIAGFLERDDPRDAFVGGPAPDLAGLPRGATVGTSALRRKAQFLMVRPDLCVTGLRGNVETRIAKVESGELAGTALALAGLHRLGLEGRATQVMPPETMLPAIGQGAICIECREKDDRMRALLVAVTHSPTATVLAAERAFLARLDGSCRTPIAGLAEIGGDGRLRFRGALYLPDGSRVFAASRLGDPSDAAAMGHDAAGEVRAQAGSGYEAALAAAH